MSEDTVIKESTLLVGEHTSPNLEGKMLKTTEHTINNDHTTHDQKPINPPTVPFKPAHLRKSFKKSKMPNTSENTTMNMKSYIPDSTETLIPLVNDDGDKNITQPRTSPTLKDMNRNISIIEDDKSILDIGKASNRNSKEEEKLYPVKKNKNKALDEEIKKVDGSKENKSNAVSNIITAKITDNKLNISKEKTPKVYNETVVKSDTIPTPSITSEITSNKSKIGKENTPKDYSPTVDKSDTLPTPSITSEITNNKSNIGKEKLPKDYIPIVDKSDTLPTPSIASEKLKERQLPIEKLNPLELKSSSEVDTHMNTSPKGKKKKMKAKNLMSKNVILKDENSKAQIEVTNNSVLEPYEKNELPSLDSKSTEFNNKPKSRIEQELDFQYQENILKAHNNAERGTEICTSPLSKSQLVDKNNVENTSEMRLKNVNDSTLKSNEKFTNSRIETRDIPIIYGDNDLSLTDKNGEQIDMNDDEISPSPVVVKLHTKKYSNKDNAAFTLPPDRAGTTSTVSYTHLTLPTILLV